MLVEKFATFTPTPTLQCLTVYGILNFKTLGHFVIIGSPLTHVCQKVFKVPIGSIIHLLGNIIQQHKSVTNKTDISHVLKPIISWPEDSGKNGYLMSSYWTDIGHAFNIYLYIHTC